MVASGTKNAVNFIHHYIFPHLLGFSIPSLFLFLFFFPPFGLFFFFYPAWHYYGNIEGESSESNTQMFIVYNRGSCL